MFAILGYEFKAWICIELCVWYCFIVQNTYEQSTFFNSKPLKRESWTMNLILKLCLIVWLEKSLLPWLLLKIFWYFSSSGSLLWGEKRYREKLPPSRWKRLDYSNISFTLRKHHCCKLPLIYGEQPVKHSFKCCYRQPEILSFPNCLNDLSRVRLLLYVLCLPFFGSSYDIFLIFLQNLGCFVTCFFIDLAHNVVEYINIT